MYTLCILYVRKLKDFYTIPSDLHPQLFDGTTWKCDLIFGNFLVRYCYTACFFPTSSLNENSVTVKKSQLLHSRWMDSNHTVVV
mmetsp:Transcript_27702/g.73174  ORF Transcript_27702/g.73174 Transcript_27702/m.73174 type:complete len:84 (+) Transcript_27702:2087-2338(+)